MLLLEYVLMDFRDTWTQWSSGGRGNNRGVQEFGVKGHLGVIWGHCSNTLKTLLHLHDSIDFDETWVKRSLARGSFGLFRNFWSEVILGSFGVTAVGQILNSLLQQIWLSVDGCQEYSQQWVSVIHCLTQTYIDFLCTQVNVGQKQWENIFT